MKKLFVLLLFIVSLTLTSCGDSKEKTDHLWQAEYDRCILTYRVCQSKMKYIGKMTPDDVVYEINRLNKLYDYFEERQSSEDENLQEAKTQVRSFITSCVLLLRAARDSNLPNIKKYGKLAIAQKKLTEASLGLE